MPFFRTLFAGLALVLVAVTTAEAGSIRSYNAAAFNAALKSGKSVVVHVHANWCITCKRQVKPLGAELAKGAFAKVAAFRVNYDRDQAFLNRYRVNTQSTILIFKKGRLVARSVGVTSRAAIAGVLKKAL